MLNDYKRKRNFKKTPEPAGSTKNKRTKHAFVIQKHHASHLHYDFRLEADGVLKSWAVPKGPSLNPKDRRLAMMVEDHPLDYASFEGTIPEGNYGAGEVIVWDTGTYDMIGNLPFREALAKGDIKFTLRGKKLKGEFALVKMKTEKDNTWLLIKKKDEYVSEQNILENNHSVLSKRRLEDPPPKNGKFKTKPAIRKIDLSDAPVAPMPHGIKPMLANVAEEPFDREGWLFEIKWDGYRAIAEIKKGAVELYSRRANDFKKKYPSIVESLSCVRHDAVIDGEVIAVNERGISQFQLLQDWDRGQKGNLLYCVFDILYLDGHDLRTLPLRRRKDILREVVDGISGIQFSDHIEERGIDFLAVAKKQGLEGILAKDGESVYREGKWTDDWQKIKIVNHQEAVIGGFTEPRGGRKHFGALVLGVYNGDELVYIGHTGGGFNDKSIAALRKQLNPLIQKDSPFAKTPKTNMPVTWVQPKLVAEIKFQEWTSDGHMRQPIFIGIREDKSPRDVVREEKTREPRKGKRFGKASPAAADSEKGLLIDDTLVKVTHPDKIFFPKEKYTKGDVIAYYRVMAPYILPYLKDRPESLHRFPNGIKEESFFQKDVDHQPPPWVRTTNIHSDTEDRDLNYLICDDERTLVYIANLGCIEINPWSSRAESLDKPDYAIFDLDPEGISFDEVIRAAHEIKKVLDSGGIASYCKTSGATGLHILIPTHARYSYDQVKNFVEIIMRTVQKRLPNTTSVERSPKKRQKRVYLDYLQNRRGQTIAAPYCIRPREGAPVSTPLDWKEVKKGLDPAKFTMKTILNRIKKKGDIMSPMLGQSIDLQRALAKLKL
jgi:bifunctional non-homologous end joining protein LigD